MCHVITKHSQPDRPMSNLVDTSALQPPINAQNPWGVQAPKIQNGATVIRPEPANMVPANMVPAASSFAEHTTKLTVYFNGKIKNMAGKCLTQSLTAASAENIFRPSTGAFLRGVPLAVENVGDNKADPSKAIVTGMTVTSIFNKFPFAVKFDWTGQGEASNSYDMRGKQAPLMMFPGEQSRSHIQIFSARDAASHPLLKKYGHVSLEGMWDQIQLINLPNGQKVAYVPINHDALKLIALNPQRFGPPPGEADIVHGSFYKMAPQQIGCAIDEMYTNILSKFNFTDLTKFKVNMYREDEKDFGDLAGSEWDHLDDDDKAASCNKTVCAAFDLQITWTCPQAASQPRAVPIVQAVPINTVIPTPSQYNAPTQYNPFQSTTFQSSQRIPVGGPKNTV